MKKNQNPWVICNADPDIEDYAKCIIELQKSKRKVTTIYIKREKCFYSECEDYGYYADDDAERPLRYKLVAE